MKLCKNSEDTAAFSEKYGVRAVALTDNSDVANIRAGDIVLYYGKVYTARDAAHKRLCECAARGGELPVDLSNACIYYCGAAPSAPGEIIGPCGPTSSIRMDPFTEPLLKLGVKVMIGKGARTIEACQAIKQYSALYLCATGGAACYIRQYIKSARCVAYPDLACEAIMELTVNGLPLVAAIDAAGGNIFRQNN